MKRLKTNEIYTLKLGASNPQDAIYLGPRRGARSSPKHVFLVKKTNKYYDDFRLYLGKVQDVRNEGEYIHMDYPEYKPLSKLEKEFLGPQIKKLQ